METVFDLSCLVYSKSWPTKKEVALRYYPLKFNKLNLGTKQELRKHAHYKIFMTYRGHCALCLTTKIDKYGKR